jgi:drug/metabolite transporter (DMT)-like permease
MKSRNIILFIICSLIWGTTWLVIKFQIQYASAVVSVFYRFLFAALLMFSFNHFVTKRTLKYPLKNHLFFLLQGFFNFSLNYILTYVAEGKMSSGLVALTFTTLVYFNMLGMWLFFHKPISKNVFWGGLLGAVGITFLFWKEILGFHNGVGPILGVCIGVVATLSASAGNMFAYKNHQLKVPVVVFNSYGMLYGSLATLGIGLLRGENFAFPMHTSFIMSLLYLVVLGSVVAFWAYQTLVGTIGADRAAYSSIIAPMLAVLVSSFFENLIFTPYIIAGILFCLLGNILSLKRD